MLNGSDVSSNNSTASITEALGKDFVVIKASEGLTYVWAGGQQVAARARAAGLLVGWYHYAHVANDPAAEARAFVAAAKALPGEVLVLDYEPYGSQALADGSAPVLVDWIRTFAATVTVLTGAPCWLYTNASLGASIRAKATADQAVTLTGMPLWKATYLSTPGSLMGWDYLACWQWTDGGGLDKNVFYGDAAMWRLLAVPPGGKPMALTVTTWHGGSQLVTLRSRDMLDALAARLPFGDKLVVVQGGRKAASSYSGGTHTEDGVLDIGRFLSDGTLLTWEQLGQLETEARAVGFAAFRRERLVKADGTVVWERHCHLIELGCTNLASEAALQVRDYYADRNGLAPRDANGLAIAADTGTRSYVDVTWETYVPPAPKGPFMALTDAQQQDLLDAVHAGRDAAIQTRDRVRGGNKDIDSFQQLQMAADSTNQKLDKIVNLLGVIAAKLGA